MVPHRGGLRSRPRDLALLDPRKPVLDLDREGTKMSEEKSFEEACLSVENSIDSTCEFEEKRTLFTERILLLFRKLERKKNLEAEIFVELPRPPWISLSNFWNFTKLI